MTARTLPPGSWWMTIALVLVLSAGTGVATDEAPSTDTSYRRADRPREWSFPRDHGSHPAFQTEWWYFTGALHDEQRREYGFELTFFRFALRPDLPAGSSKWRARDLVTGHFTITEVDKGHFHLAEGMQRAAAGLAGADTDSLRVWKGSWEALQVGEGFRITAGDDGDGGFGIELALVPERGPVLHGENGLSWKSEDHTHASYYYSMPRLETRGTLTVEGEPRAVEGTTWMDHEFFTGDTPVQGVGWDWFSCRLDDGRDLMLYLLRYPDGSRYRAGTLVEVDGSSRALDTEDLRAEVLRRWESPRTGASYPVAWRLSLPAESLELEVEARLDAQEVRAEETVGFAYWEGLCAYRGSFEGEAVTGEGYVELTGYAAPAP